MQRYRAFTPGMQVRGQVIQAATKCINSEHIEPYLRQNGLLGRQDDLQPILADRWYSLQDWLNVLTSLLEEKLDLWSRTYQAQHRDGDAGEITVHRMGNKLIWVDARTPYPDDILYGAIYAIASHHFPASAGVTVRYDDAMPRRDKGGDVTRFQILWG